MWKKLPIWIATIWLFLGLTQNSFAAIGATAVWEVRTTGNAQNGGFYTTGGTDWSQQNAAKYALTGCTTAAANAIILTASASADMVGNGLYVVSGTNFTPGWYGIISVVAGVSITVDRNCTTDVGALGVVNIGGAVDHPNTISTVVVAGNTIYIAGGTYVKVGANAYVLSISVSGGNGTPIMWEGYASSRGDFPTGATRPIFDGDSDNNGTGDTTNCLVIGNTNGNLFKYLICKRASADNITSGSSGTGYLYYVRSTAAADDGIVPAASMVLHFCEMDTNVSEGLTNGSTSATTLFGCYAHDNGADGLENTSTGSLSAYLCISETNVGAGYNFGKSGTAINSIAYNNSGATSDGFIFGSNQDGNAFLTFILNCISKDNGRDGFRRSATTRNLYVFDYNCYNGHATELTNIIAGNHDVGDVDPSFTNAAGADFTLQVGSPALATGFPQTMLGATGTYKWNIGIDQDDNTATTGGGGQGGRNARIGAGIGG